MPRYDHLILERLPQRFERRKKRGFGAPPHRNPITQADRVQGELNAAIDSQRRRSRPTAIHPDLILRVSMQGQTFEDDWEALGLTVLSSDSDKSLILFSSNEDLRQFRDRIAAYRQGPRDGQRDPPYNSFLSSIDSIGAVDPSDRIGFRLRDEGISHLQDFGDDTTYEVDVEIWDLGTRRLRTERVGEIANYVEENGGELIDTYIGPSITLARVRASGSVIRVLLTIEAVASVDFAPAPDTEIGELLDIELSSLPTLLPPAEDCPVVGIIDSGLNAHPLLDAVAVGAVGIRDEGDTADVWGHGTRVAGIAAYGDLRSQLTSGTLIPGARICAAKVLNDSGKFDSTILVPKLMDQAVRRLHSTFGCRVFVISLGDRNHPYRGGKVGSWAATLDELARELDVLIIVSAGNRKPRSGDRLEEAVSDYPRYLLEDENRLLEPAGAAIALSVGSLAHGEGIAPSQVGDPRVRPITRAYEPSPFTRVGPGLGGAVKPELVDVGGTMVFDSVIRTLLDGKSLASAGVVTTHHRSIEKLFTSSSGTSLSAPRVAFGAAQILQRLPNASANLLRALLVGAAKPPDEAIQRLSGLQDGAVGRICGHGVVHLEKAAFSDDGRVVLYAEDSLTVDHMAIYRVPIPAEFQTQSGDRTIRVTLAYDPPVRHSRSDYRGLTMDFRLVRGVTPSEIFEHYRRRAAVDGPVPDLPDRFQCKLEPGPQERDRSTVQTAAKTYRQNLSNYGDDYHLVVRCLGGWAGSDIEQRFAVVVEISHQANIQLYERVRQRIRLST